MARRTRFPVAWRGRFLEFRHLEMVRDVGEVGNAAATKTSLGTLFKRASGDSFLVRRWTFPGRQLQIDSIQSV